jgi:crossover junction endodeoxyribonuclease RuvC
VRVLGIDPGLTRCGVAVVDGASGRKVELVHVDVIRTASDQELPLRLLALEREFESIIDEHRPASIAIERVFAQHNVSTVMGTAQVSGVALLVAARHGLPVAMHTPTEVKAAVTGSGRAGKAQVAAMVVRILGLDAAPKPVDATDALALAICHAWRGPAQARLEAAVLAQKART